MSIPARIGPVDHRHQELRDWLACELERVQPGAGEVWLAVLEDKHGDATFVPVPELIARLDAGERFDGYEMFVEPFARAVAS